MLRERVAEAGVPAGAAERRPGRPRDTEIQQRVLRAVVELIDDGATVTVGAVVQRSGVSRAAIYRRWETLTELLAAALDVGRVVVHPPRDVPVREAWRHGYPKPGEQALGDYPEARLRQRLVLALSEEQLQRQYWHRHVLRRREPILALLEEGRERGEIREDADLEAALDLLSGVYYYQVVARGESLSNDETLARCNAAIEIIWQGIAAP